MLTENPSSKLYRVEITLHPNPNQNEYGMSNEVNCNSLDEV